MINSLTPEMSWQLNDIYSVLPVLLTFAFFTLYWFISQSDRIRRKFYSNNDPDEATVYHISFNRIAGFVLMGIFPLLICLILLPGYTITDFGLKLPPENPGFTAVAVILLALIMIPIVSGSARRPQIQGNHPQIRARIWTRKTAVIDALTWALYLLGYEILFRGVLLFPVAEALGVWAAIAINIALYSAAHIPHGKAETIAAVPFGLVLCILTLYSGTIWIAFLAHLVNALTVSFSAMKYNPEMRYISTWRKAANL
ncbi:MAG: CPBP family intramembrane metalloprotease [Bacteroidales bacterium]|nr:CPBP family intramembrane metalloprotease [Bacteroidales bacterium]MDT8373547.1 CPBP family intramembrane glutamic endopeptidase [Bacteroidales bacterium]